MQRKTEKAALAISACALVGAVLVPLYANRAIQILNQGDCVQINTGRQSIQQLECGSGSGSKAAGAKGAPSVVHTQQVELWAKHPESTSWLPAFAPLPYALIQQSNGAQTIELGSDFQRLPQTLRPAPTGTDAPPPSIPATVPPTFYAPPYAPFGPIGGNGPGTPGKPTTNTPTTPPATPTGGNNPSTPPSDVSEPPAWFDLLIIPCILALCLLMRKKRGF